MKREKDGISLSENCIFLYGDNSLSRQKCVDLLREGYSVAGIIDNKFTSINYGDNGLVYVSINNIKEIDNIETCIVIICLSNGQLHEQIALVLRNIGINKILYLPMNEMGIIYNQMHLRREYQKFIEGDYSEIIIKTEDIEFNNRGYRIINRTKKCVVFWCPKGILKVLAKEVFEKIVHGKCLLNIEEFLKYKDSGIDEFKPYIDLFKFLAGESKKPDEYLRLQRNNDEDRVVLLNDRRKLFQLFEDKYRYDMIFFMDSPADADVSNTGEVLIKDGLHRIFFLNQQGREDFPIRVSINDFSKLPIREV